LGKIFDPFYTTKPPGKGTGLGLFISLNLVHNLGGFLDVQSQVGKGTRFIILLPMTSTGMQNLRGEASLVV
jgi:signal transduction histidine kinase